MLDGLNLRDSVDLAQLLERVLAYRPDLVIVDTVNRTFGAGDENEGRDMGEYLDACERLRLDGKASAVMLVHHSGKDATKGPRGHTSLFASMTTVLMLKEMNRAQARLLLHLEKQKRGPKIDPISLMRVQVRDLGRDEDGQELTSCILVPTGESPTKANVLNASYEASLRALYALPNHGGKSGEWRKKTGLADKTFQNHRQALLRDGWINSPQRAYYSLTDAGLTLCA